MEDLSKIHNVNDFLDFKLSIKTIVIIIGVWITICGIIMVIALGGINNAVEYITNMVDYVIRGKAKGNVESSLTNKNVSAPLSETETEPIAANK
jgi:hypothetical protein